MAKGFNRAALVALLVALPVAIGSGAAAASSPRMVRVGAAPRVPAGARSLGAVSSSAPLSGTVVLKPRDNAALVQFINAVSNPSSRLFHQYLPAGAFAGRFGPTAATIDGVRSQLAADGLRVTGVSSDGLLVDFSGSTAQIETAFQTGVERYRLADGSTGQTMTSAATLPSAVAGSVEGIVGLNDLARATPAAIVRAPASDRGRIRRPATATFSHPSGAPTPCPAATADAQQFGGLTDDQIATPTAPSACTTTAISAQGQHIALYELEPFVRSDIRTFDTCYFGASASSGDAQPPARDPGRRRPAGRPRRRRGHPRRRGRLGDGPGRQHRRLRGPEPGRQRCDLRPRRRVRRDHRRRPRPGRQHELGPVRAGHPAGQPGLQQAENLLFEQAVAQGQSVFAAAGDNGSDDCNTFETHPGRVGAEPGVRR